MIRYGIIGAGRMGNMHASQTKFIPGTGVSSVYDSCTEAAEKMHKEYGAVVCSSADELAESPDVDCVIIASPTYCHPEGIRAAVAAHKPIFCEKALCRTPEEADELLTLLGDYDKLFTVGFVRRYMAKSLRMKQLLEEGVIGKLRYCNVDLSLPGYRRMPGDWFADFELCGGVIIDMLAHHIDLANWYFGPAKRVYAESLLLSRDQPLPVDYAAAVVTYGNGLICNMLCSWQRFGRSCERMEIYGDHGALVMDGGDLITHFTLDGKTNLINPETEPPDCAAERIRKEGNADSAFFRQLNSVTEVLHGRSLPLPTIQDAYDSLKVSFAMIESTRSGNSVVF